MGKKISENIASEGLLRKGVVLHAALVDMLNVGVLHKGQNVLEETSVRNIVSWNALIARYVQQSQQLELRCEAKVTSNFTYIAS